MVTGTENITRGSKDLWRRHWALTFNVTQSSPASHTRDTGGISGRHWDIKPWHFKRWWLIKFTISLLVSEMKYGRKTNNTDKTYWTWIVNQICLRKKHNLNTRPRWERWSSIHQCEWQCSYHINWLRLSLLQFQSYTYSYCANSKHTGEEKEVSQRRLETSLIRRHRIHFWEKMFASLKGPVELGSG